jgi:hypothetical protein
LLGTALARKSERDQQVIRRLREAHVRELAKIASDKRRYALFRKILKRDRSLAVRAVEATRSRKPALQTVPLLPEARFRLALTDAQSRIRCLCAQLGPESAIRSQLESVVEAITAALGSSGWPNCGAPP